MIHFWSLFIDRQQRRDELRITALEQTANGALINADSAFARELGLLPPLRESVNDAYVAALLGLGQRQMQQQMQQPYGNFGDMLGMFPIQQTLGGLFGGAQQQQGRRH